MGNIFNSFFRDIHGYSVNFVDFRSGYVQPSLMIDPSFSVNSTWITRSSVWLENVPKPVCDLNCPDPSDVPFGFIYIMPDGYMKDAATRRRNLTNGYHLGLVVGSGWFWLVVLPLT